MNPKPTKKSRLAKEIKIGELDKVFSYYIRLRDADDNGGVVCISCGKYHFWYNSGMDNGHYIKRQWMGTRFNKVNCNAQCRYCNHYLQGNDVEYRKNLIHKFGQEAVNLIEAIQKTKRKYKQYELKELMIIYCNKVLAELERQPKDDLYYKIQKEINKILEKCK